MRLTTYSDYALRLLMYCALHSTRHVTIAEVSQAYGISKNHLMKIAQELVQTGFLDSTRGRNGGLRLARPAEDINIGAVVRSTESGSFLVECFDRENNTCIITPACKLKHVLYGATEAFYRELDKQSLADLLPRPKQMLALLPARGAA